MKSPFEDSLLETIPENLLGERHRPKPGCEPIKTVDGVNIWHRSDIDILQTRKSWRRKKRYVPEDQEPVHTYLKNGMECKLYSREQTINEEENFERRREALQEECDAWLQEWQDLNTHLARWISETTIESVPGAEYEWPILIDRRDKLEPHRIRLNRAAIRLELTLPPIDHEAWKNALDHYQKTRFHAFLAELEDPDDHELAKTVYQRIVDADQKNKDPEIITPYYAIYGRFFKRLERERLQRNFNNATRIHEFHNLFPARNRTRKFTLYLGPTNSGKTYQALRRLAEAKSGAYLAPLRLLALEVAETLWEWNVPCNMITGEERIQDEAARHTASTIEMLALKHEYDICVIDEAQMLGDPDRGWAWTQAILGAQADEVCVIAAPEALPAIKKLLKLTGDPYDIVRLERLTPLTLIQKPIKTYKDLEPGTAIIAFSRSGVLRMKQKIESETGKSCAVLYGALPPEVRRMQAKRFSDGDAPFLAATDAIGMGLNLPIRTILFTQDAKKYNHQEHPLTPMEVRQIAGRAGRYGQNEIGFVGSFQITMHNIRMAYQKNPPDVTRAHLAPNLDHLMAMADISEYKQPKLARLLTQFSQAVKPDPTLYAMTDLDGQTTLARITDRYKSLDLATRFALSAAPVHLGATQAVSAFERMTEAIARGWKLSLESILPRVVGEDTHRLSQLETAMKVVNLYCWLHYRFPDLLPDLHTAIHKRQKINNEIDLLLGKSWRHMKLLPERGHRRSKGKKFTKPKNWKKYHAQKHRRQR
ncbi:MAG: hypothetical protein HQL54_00660 [Magnetococcales bacterium]|nr:hypothetical protein [Magnetococcales bacterium]